MPTANHKVMEALDSESARPALLRQCVVRLHDEERCQKPALWPPSVHRSRGVLEIMSHIR
jgi:hypothetical protein